ncbi:hypothetical protein M9H77_17638 [Catharanthus roseus]|uniref:Uncharacterized protein n=1 Tax=Catharanthus roseus TaxID=4058 RepID=A0ACC0B566_CATRO|nr:hypothetical protein M9H77_17638 [Catharanthus roseus]
MAFLHRDVPSDESMAEQKAKQVVFSKSEEETEGKELERVDEEFYEPCFLVRPLLTTHKDDKEGNDWKRSNNFQTRVQCNRQLCSMVIEPGSCSNVISEGAVRKLGLETKPHRASDHSTSFALNTASDIVSYSTVGRPPSKDSGGARNFWDLCNSCSIYLPVFAAYIVTRGTLVPYSAATDLAEGLGVSQDVFVIYTK